MQSSRLGTLLEQRLEYCSALDHPLLSTALSDVGEPRERDGQEVGELEEWGFLEAEGSGFISGM